MENGVLLNFDSGISVLGILTSVFSVWVVRLHNHLHSYLLFITVCSIIDLHIL